MSNLPQSDWILAGRFVDHDLPIAEAARTESRIATDPQFAAAVEKIRQQSDLFRGLPNFKPPEDLKERTVQASLDQVKALMGAWPVEERNDGERNDEERNQLDSTSTRAAANSFDWKSVSALVASLAGVLIIGTMLWPLQGTTPEDNVAMGTAPAAKTADSIAGMDSVAANDQATESGIANRHSKGGQALQQKSLHGFASKTGASDALLPVQTPSTAFPSAPDPRREITTEGIIPKRASPRVVTPEKMAKGSAVHALPQTGPMFGTPMTRPKADALAPNFGSRILAANPTAPIDQIWCIHQDSNVSRETVSQILNLNQIKVQREQPPTSVYANKEPAEAFYVAATQQQMILAMSQISNNADVEMIQLPGAGNSPIADAIAQQFARSNLPPAKIASQQQAQQTGLAPGFRKPKSQALAQQLFANSLPRNFVPSGSVPPILNSDASDLELQNGVDDKRRSESNLLSKSEIQLPAKRLEIAKRSKSKPAFAAESGGGEADAKDEETVHGSAEGVGGSTAQQAQNKSLSPATDLKDTVEEGSEEQLRQYLILIRGGEEEQ